MPKKKILLADDSNTVLLLHRMMLQGQGYDLVIARNGREAVDKAIAECPDLVFMDVVMPEMNGFDACQALRRHEATRSTPVIMVTTRGEPQNVRAGYEAGCNDYVTKPFDTLELMAKLKAFLGE